MIWERPEVRKVGTKDKYTLHGKKMIARKEVDI